MGRHAHRAIRHNSQQVRVEVITAKPSAPKEMKKWPDDPSLMVSYQDLIGPLRSIVYKGYKLERLNINDFEYSGFNIGKDELDFSLPPDLRFKKKALEEENSKGRKLIDVILNVAFLLGMEQGRRKSHQEIQSIDSLISTLENYREINKDLRRKIDQLEIAFELKELGSDLSKKELSVLANTMMEERKSIRLAEAKKELKLDNSKSEFKFLPKKKIPFKELKIIAEEIKNNCSIEQWKEIIIQYGWTLEEWQEKCKKKNFNVLTS